MLWCQCVDSFEHTFPPCSICIQPLQFMETIKRVSTIPTVFDSLISPSLSRASRPIHIIPRYCKMARAHDHALPTPVSDSGMPRPSRAFALSVCALYNNTSAFCSDRHVQCRRGIHDCRPCTGLRPCPCVSVSHHGVPHFKIPWTCRVPPPGNAATLWLVRIRYLYSGPL